MIVLLIIVVGLMLISFRLQLSAKFIIS